MKKLIIIVALAVGCSTSQPKVYTTLATTEQAVDAGYKAYLDLAVMGRISTNNVPIVSKAYDAFQTAMSIAVVLGQSTNALASSNIVNSATQVLALIAAEEGK